MLEEHIKESLSNHFIGAIASSAGFIISKSNYDYGVDITLIKVATRIVNGNRKRYYIPGNELDIQIKSTTKATKKRNYIYYNLDIKNYNDLVLRNGKGHKPLIFILFILPEEKDKRLNFGYGDGLTIKKEAYWYQPPLDTKQSTNKETVQIAIPKDNKVKLDTFDTIISNLK